MASEFIKFPKPKKSDKRRIAELEAISVKREGDFRAMQELVLILSDGGNGNG